MVTGMGTELEYTSCRIEEESEEVLVVQRTGLRLQNE